MKTKVVSTGKNLFTEINRIENREEKLAEINSVMLTPGGSIFRTIIIKGNSSGTHDVSTAMVYCPLAFNPMTSNPCDNIPTLKGVVSEPETEKKKRKTEK